jgi:catechol 2,3-dioxygenase-like lactoylglutathione lyase family enzyme
MEPTMSRMFAGILVCFLGGCSTQPTNTHAAPPTAPSAKAKNDQRTGDGSMRLGNFSVSLAVKDIAVSRTFYEKLGLKVIGGNQTENWLILQNETSTIGLFQGMFDKNLLTFNPGWDRNCTNLQEFDDVRDIQRTLKRKGLTLATAADESTQGPASLMLVDPDGNPILIDQHVPSPPR